MVFMSKAKRLRVILKPAFYILDANGQRVQIPGNTKEFVNGRIELDNPDDIALMLKHDYCNIKFMPVENEGEWKAQHPEYFQSPVAMITGAVATINSAPAPLVDAARVHIPPLPQNQARTDPVVNIEEIIDKKIASAIDPLSEKLDRLLNAKIERPKKVFTCPVPGCGQVFRTGIALGEHKKLTHVAQRE